MSQPAKAFLDDKENLLTIDDLQRAVIDIVKGCDYGLSKLITVPNTSLKKVRKVLSKIKGSLAEEIANMRREQL
jgi:hypothetical protein